MNWTIIVIAFFIAVFGALPIIGSHLGEKWRCKRFKRFEIRSKHLAWCGSLGVIILTFISTCESTKDSIKDEAEKRKLLDSSKAVTEKLMRYEGIHDIYPRFWFFRSKGGTWRGANKFASRIQVLYQNPGDYPIYDVNIEIVEVSEWIKWNNESNFGMKPSAQYPPDATGKINPPPYVKTKLHFTVLHPKEFHDTTIYAPPSAGKFKYEYSVDVRAKNGRAIYKYHYVKRQEPKPLFLTFLNFYIADTIWKADPETGNILELIEEYRESGFPDN